MKYVYLFNNRDECIGRVMAPPDIDCIVLAGVTYIRSVFNSIKFCSVRTYYLNDGVEKVAVGDKKAGV